MTAINDGDEKVVEFYKEMDKEKKRSYTTEKRLKRMKRLAKKELLHQLNWLEGAHDGTL